MEGRLWDTHLGYVDVWLNQSRGCGILLHIDNSVLLTRFDLLNTTGRMGEYEMFDPGLNIGDVLKNSGIVDRFKCGNMGGMRRSNATNTLVLISDYTKGIYHDKWIGGVLHYTGMGKSGDQDILWAQNATLAGSRQNGVDVHLFEVIDAGEYVYCGRIELVDKPYTEIQPGEDGIDRKVWMFPIRPVPDNDVRKPSMFVFADMEDYKARGKNVDAEYAKILAEKKKPGIIAHTSAPAPVIQKPVPKPPVVIPKDIIGKRVKHKSFGIGTITSIDGAAINVDFETVGAKKMGYEFCMKNNILQYLE